MKLLLMRLCHTWNNYLHLINDMNVGFDNSCHFFNVESLSNSEMSSIAILPSLNYLKSAIRDIQI